MELSATRRLTKTTVNLSEMPSWSLIRAPSSRFPTLNNSLNNWHKQQQRMNQRLQFDPNSYELYRLLAANL